MNRNSSSLSQTVSDFLLKVRRSDRLAFCVVGIAFWMLYQSLSGISGAQKASEICFCMTTKAVGSQAGGTASGTSGLTGQSTGRWPGTISDLRSPSHQQSMVFPVEPKRPLLVTRARLGPPEESSPGGPWLATNCDGHLILE